MPIYRYQCTNGHTFENFLTIAGHVSELACECGAVATQIISAPLLVKASADVCYDSPIDGRPITSWQARREDLARNHCRPYDPEMKKDAERFREDSRAEIDKAIDATVEEAIEKMPSSKRSQLASELVEQGLTMETVRK